MARQTAQHKVSPAADANAGNQAAKKTRKRATNVTIRGDLLEQARELSINLSHEFENHLEQLIRKRRAAQWLLDNQQAIDAYNRFVEKHGIWNEEFRGW